MVPRKNIQFFFEGVSIGLTQRNRLKSFIRKLFINEGLKLKSLNYVFCSDKELLRINREWLGHDFYTDIITFDLSETKSEKVAEIYISVDRVRENAIAFGIPIKKELLRVIFHGVLHLCGYRDKTAQEKEIMRKKENACLDRYLA